LGLIALFMGGNSWRSFQHARLLHNMEKAPARSDAQCPACQAPPPLGPFWVCHHCRTQFDTFATQAVCPKCQQPFPVTACPFCGAFRPIAEWLQPRAERG
jgi:hypothetical protein